MRPLVDSIWYKFALLKMEPMERNFGRFGTLKLSFEVCMDIFEGFLTDFQSLIVASFGIDYYLIYFVSA